jgi:hypothetical protein
MLPGVRPGPADSAAGTGVRAVRAVSIRWRSDAMARRVERRHVTAWHSLRVALAWMPILLALAMTLPGAGAEAPAPASPTPSSVLEQELEPEVPDDPPGIPAKPVPGAAKAAVIQFGRFTHIQVNVDGNGANIPGDAANEPSIAVDPTNHDRMAIGWRQFATVASNFRQAGHAHTTDGGRTWTVGILQPGVFRSDPVLASDAGGSFYYSSLTERFEVSYFISSDRGGTWSPPVFAYGGDKQWFTVDRGPSTGHGYIYQSWSTASNPTPPNTFNRSTTGAQDFDSPVTIPQSPIWGTLDVASDGTVYMSGVVPGNTSTPAYVARSTNARQLGAVPQFTTQSVDLGGRIRGGGFETPNPAGILGQMWVAADRSAGSRRGWVYALASVGNDRDPMDVHFVRSTDAGLTWSAPLRVNDDPAGNGAWQWFGTMSVSPNGRIDVVWNDTQGTADVWSSALRYIYSTDGGITWSGSEQVSPVWRSDLGWPNQDKIGDYYHMVSDSTGADLAWAATFNGEQDVYYVRLTPAALAAGGDSDAPTRLRPPVPNPFGTWTTMAFDLPPGGGHARLEVYDSNGRRIATLVNGTLDGGPHLARWNGTDQNGNTVGSGLYFCRLESGGTSEMRRVVMIRR